MDKGIALSKIYNNVEYNPACFNFSEEEARAKKLWRDERPMPTLEQLQEAYREAEKEQLVSEKYNLMVQDVYEGMEAVFGTKNDVSAAAFAATWEAMLKRPNNYIDESMGFINEEAVVAYATEKLNASDAYGLLRLKRIAQYQAQKQAIENG